MTYVIGRACVDMLFVAAFRARAGERRYVFGR
jgi:hypothetical protein